MRFGGAQDHSSTGSVLGEIWLHETRCDEKMINHLLRLSSIGVLLIGVAHAGNATDVLQSLAPELQYQPVIDRVCIQGFYARAYRLQGQLNIGRAISKLAGIIPLGSVGEVQHNFFLARWSNAPQHHLIGLWPVSEHSVEGIYSTLSSSDQSVSVPQTFACKHWDSVPQEMTAWIKPAMGLRVVLSTVDHARLDPSYTLIYSSWLPSSRLVAAISVALSKAGWNLGLARAPKGPHTSVQSIVATKASVQLNLRILTVQGSSILFVVGQ